MGCFGIFISGSCSWKFRLEEGIVVGVGVSGFSACIEKNGLLELGREGLGSSEVLGMRGLGFRCVVIRGGDCFQVQLLRLRCMCCM